MSRKMAYLLAMGLASTAIMAVMIFGVGTAFNVMFLGGMADGKMWQVILSGPVALVSIVLIQKSLDAIDWLGKWKVGRV